MRRPKWSTVVIALALIAVLAIASPALSVSIKKLVKKEVAKQISKAQGPAGPQGPPGPAGADGTAKAGARVVGSDASFTSGTAFGGIEAVKDAAGGYCLKVPFDPKNVVVTVTGNTKHAQAQLTRLGGFGICPTLLPGYNAWVTTHLNSNESLSDSDFFVLIN
jgi:hypothetical protein